MGSRERFAMAKAVAPMTDRRRRRREETIQEILTIAVELMTAEGVAALSLTDVARRLGIQPPSLYKYFPSKLALYDAVFAEGARRVRDEFRAAVATAEPGLPALAAGIGRFARLALAYPVYAQLLYWRPVPGFVPSPESYQPAQEFVADVTAVLRTAADLGQVHPDAATEDGHTLLSVLVGGALSSQAANEPDASFEDGRYVRLLPRLLDMFVASYPPEERRS
jgi:AcrR family transcriptional regulator